MILASQSPRRVELMREAGFSFSVRPANIDEAPLAHEGARELVERLARTKALQVLADTGAEGELVLAADTIVYLDEDLGDVILGKPADEADAHRMLEELSGRTHHVATGVAIAASRGGEREAASFVSVTDVEFYRLDEEQIEAYVRSGSPLDKAGAYGIQDPLGRLLVKRIDGDFYNVVGLPVARTVRCLRLLSDLWDVPLA